MSRTATELEVALLEAEVEQLERELALGYAVPGKRRPFPHELRAGVRFAELDRQAEELSLRLSRAALASRNAVAAQLEALDLPDDPRRALAVLRQLADPSSGRVLPLVGDLVDRLAERIALNLVATAADSAGELLEEARRQGLTVLPELIAVDSDGARALADQARRAAVQPVAHSLGVALEAAERLAAAGAGAGGRLMREGIARAVRSASVKSTEDTARQAASVAQSVGRTTAAKAAPRPSSVYASELLDTATCGPCARVDGRTYTTLEEALLDYPGAGGHVFCEGGQRCRGTLVYVWDEAPATPRGDDPGPPRPAIDPPPDRTPPALLGDEDAVVGSPAEPGRASTPRGDDPGPPRPAIDPPPDRTPPALPDDRVLVPKPTPAPAPPATPTPPRPPGHPPTPGIDGLPPKPVTPFGPSPVDVDFDSAATNPGYGRDSNYGVSCVHVVNAYELRRRGLEVTATPLPASSRGRGRDSNDALGRWRTEDGGRRYLLPTTPKRLAAEVESWPVGARGWVSIRWGRNYGGGGHIYNVERTEDGARYVEAQLGTVPTDLEAKGRLAKRSSATGSLRVVRVDDLTPTDDVLEFVTERGTR